MNFAQRTVHQFRQEWRHLYLFSLAWWVVLTLTTLQQQATISDYYAGIWRTPLQAATLLGAALLTIYCIAHDAPASTDTASLTRPIGRGACWLGKLAFLLSALSLPWIVSDAVTVLGYGYDAAHWVTLACSSLLLSLLIISSSAALASLPVTRLQFGGIFITAIALAGIWFTGGINAFAVIFGKFPGLASNASIASTRLECGSAIATTLAVSLALLAWWRGTLARSRRQTIALLAMALVQWPLVRAHSPVDWLAKPELTYPNKNLELAIGSQGPVSEMPGGNLWRFLRVKNVPTGEGVTVKSFGPIQGKPIDNYTDFRPKHSTFFTDQIRFVVSGYPASDLWTDQTTSWRTPLYDLIKPNELRAKKQPWNLELAVFGLNKVIDVPLADLLQDGGSNIAMRPGVRLNLHLIPEIGLDNTQLDGEIRARRSTFQAPLPHASTVTNVTGFDRGMPPDVVAIFHNPVTQEHHISIIHASFTEDVEDFAWMTDCAYRVNLHLPLPKARMAVTGLKLEDWIKDVTVSFWLPVERGTTRFQIPAEALAAAAEAAKAQSMK